MNIYMSGAHGTGKSTTARILAEKAGLSLIPSASRMSPYQHGSIEHQDYVMDQVFKRCSTWDGVIHERTPFDVYAYTRDYAMGGTLTDLPRHSMKVEAFARIMIQREDILFYFPITFPLVDDGVRPNAYIQKEVDHTMSQMIDRFNVTCVTVPKGSPEERADFILKELSHAEL